MERLSLAWQRMGVSLGHDVKQQRWGRDGGGTETNTQEWTIVMLKCTQVVEDEKLKSHGMLS